MSYRIITDSACDLPENKEQEWLTRIPLSINLGEKVIIDDDDLNSETLLNEISASPVGPTSACPSPGTFAEHYAGTEDDLYVVTLTKELSGTYNSAIQGKEIYLEDNPGKNIHVFNSKTACAGEVLICEKVRELAESGLPFADVVAQTEAFIEEAGTMFVLEDLEILRKSGRMSALQAAVTSTLKLKLVMCGTKEGTIAKVTQALSMTQAINKMVHIISEKALSTNKGDIPMLVITHCIAKERAEYIINKLKETCNVAEAIICKAGGIGTMYASRGGVVVSFS